MKKSILLMVLGLVLTNLSTQAATEINGIWYEFNDGKQTATVVAATAPAYYAGDVVIPAKVNASGNGPLAFMSWSLVSKAVTTCSTVGNLLWAGCSLLKPHSQ